LHFYVSRAEPESASDVANMMERRLFALRLNMHH
jgi:hypothetical protein